VQTPRSFQLENVIDTAECPMAPSRPSSECLTSVRPGSEADRQKTTLLARFVVGP
jgi:hypothetical protein